MDKFAFRNFFLFLLIFHISIVSAQKDIQDSSITVPMIYGFYGYQIAGGDMAERFGNNSVVGPGFQVKLKSQWIFGLEFNYLWGNKVKNADEILGNVLTSDGQVISTDGTYAIFDMFERGYSIMGHAGRLFNVLAPNPNSGIMVKVGAGYMQHWVRIQIGDFEVPWLEDDYAKGYDRLTGGFALSEFIGYLYLGNTRVLNFYAGFEFTQGWTRGLRDVDFDTGQKDNSKRFELLNGFKIGWIIPIYKRKPEAYYFY